MNAKVNYSEIDSQQTTIMGKLKRLFQFREASILSIVIALFILLTIITPNFLSKSNIFTTLVGLSMDGIVAIGMTLVLATGGVDLAVGSVLAFTGVLAGFLALHGVNIWLAVLIALIVAGVAGWLNGHFISRIGLNPLIMTLGMMSVARGLAYVITQGAPISLVGLNPAFTFLGQGIIFGVPMIVIILFIVVIIGDIMLRKSVSLRKVYYVGSNEKAARLSGINEKKVKLWVYILCSLLAGLAGLLSLARFSVATPTAGTGAELRTIAACVIGGASLSGGAGTILGSLLGVILVGFVNNGLVLLGVSVYWQDLVTGLVLILAVTWDVYSNKRKKKKMISEQQS